ncbi:MAG: hypothetical protein ACRCS0_11815 [Albidovulum sp.]
MDLALTALKWMMGITVVQIILSLALLLTGQSGMIVSALMLCIQLAVMALLSRGLKADNMIAASIFGLVCVLLLLTGIPREASLSAIFDAAFAVMAFVGLAGLWHWRRDRLTAREPFRPQSVQGSPPPNS